LKANFNSTHAIDFQTLVSVSPSSNGATSNIMADKSANLLDGLQLFSGETAWPKAIRYSIAVFILGFAALPTPCVARQEWRVGVASKEITPQEPIWMAGYASRRKPSEGVLTPLFAKAIVFEDESKNRFVMVTSDLVAIPKELRDSVAEAVRAKHRIDKKSLMLNCSHTHCGPVVRDNLEMSVMYPLDPSQRNRVEAYFLELRDKIVRVIDEAILNLMPSKIGFSHARCGFAMNRRLPSKSGYQNSPYPDGPVDHDVPILRIESNEGQLRAVVFGYACHNTSTALMQINGDYAGYAQQAIEATHPGTIAMFVMGCGGDQNPYPRGKIEHAQAHGNALATAVEAALLPQPTPIQGKLGVAYQEVDLSFAMSSTDENALPPNDELDKRRADSIKQEKEKNGTPRKTYPYPVQVIRFGNALTMIALGGEVVVDYSHKLKIAYGTHPVWVAGYSNDVMAYIPSERVLAEGGYEGGGAMRFTNLPGPWKPGIEDRILSTIDTLYTSLR
jgi:hypothetical protein